MKSVLSYVLILFLLIFSVSVLSADELDDDFAMYDDEEIEINDPLEPLNRAFFQFNDKMYIYVLDPVAQSYAKVMPEDFRLLINNVFKNILAPVRIVNNLLQGKFSNSGTELTRFVINTVAGAGGMGDPAKDVFNISQSNEDLGQTLGVYGVGEGFFICWPFLGPSNIRDTLGMIGDSFLVPIAYIEEFETAAAIHAGRKVNYVSTVLGEYEQFFESAFDPYIAMRDFYSQTRRSKVNDKNEVGEQQLFSSNIHSDKSPMVVKENKENTASSHKEENSKKFFIQVGAFTDQENVKDLVDRLFSLDKQTVVVEYDRGDYNFYGVQVSGGDSFKTAKLAELELNSAGFSETLVVSR